MQLVGRPKLAKPLPKALPRTAVEALLETVAQDQDSQRQTDWAERDLAIILTALLAACAPRNSARPTSAISAPPTTAPPSSASKVTAARSAACPSRPNCYR